MLQFGGKDSKRHFTVVMGGKEHGLYVSSTPSSAAKKAVTKLCAANKGKKVEFSIREITQGSKKKTYGPYKGHIEKLKEPIELKGRVIKYKPVAKLNGKANKKTVVKKKSVQKGGKIYTGDYEVIFEGPDDILGLIDDNLLEDTFDLSVEITRESNKIIIKLINIKNEETWLLEDKDFLIKIFTTLEYWINYYKYKNKYESRNKLLDDISKIKVYFKKYYFENKNSKRITTFTKTDLFNKIRRFKIAFFTMDDDIGNNFLCAIKKELKKIYNISFDLIGIQKNILDYIDKYGYLFYVIDDYTTLTIDEIIQELKKIIKSKVYMSAAERYQKKIYEKISSIDNENWSKDLFNQYQDQFNLSSPILIDESGNEIMINW